MLKIKVYFKEGKSRRSVIYEVTEKSNASTYGSGKYISIQSKQSKETHYVDCRYVEDHNMEKTALEYLKFYYGDNLSKIEVLQRGNLPGKKYLTLIIEDDGSFRTEDGEDVGLFAGMFCNIRPADIGNLVDIIYGDSVEELMKYEEYKELFQHTRYIESGWCISHGRMIDLAKDIEEFEEYEKKEEEEEEEEEEVSDL